MSKSKFNLKSYQKTNGDDHIDRKLQKEHEEAPTSITEKQLDGNRVNEKDVILEKLLENKRLGSADVIIEKNLNDSKGLFAPLRNSDTYTGNINKIEEKRLAGDKMEDEKYEVASKTPKSERWWEHLASTSSKIVATAAPRKNILRDVLEDDRMDKFTPQKGFELAREMGVGDEANEGLVPDKGDVGNEFIGSSEPEEQDPEQEDTDVSLGLGEKTMNFSNIKVTEKPWPSMLFQLVFDSSEFDNDQDEIKQTALEKVLAKYPNLSDKISVDDFNNPTLKGQKSAISLALVGPEYFKQSQEDVELFSGYDVDEADMGGTPVTLGRVKLSPQAVEMASENREELVDMLSEYIIDQDPEMKDVGIANYFNFAALPKGEVTFVIGAPQEQDMAADAPEATETEASPLTEETQDDFPIEDFNPENTVANSSKLVTKIASDFEKPRAEREQKKN
jgi:hypothetical protein